MNNIILIMLHELRKIFKTSSIFSVMILGPIFYFFFYPQPYLHEIARDIPIAVIDMDNTTMSRQLIRNIDATDTINIRTYQNDLEAAKQKLNDRQIYGYVIIPNTFEKKLLAGEQSPIAFYGDASYILIYGNVATAISSVAATMAGGITVNREISAGIDPAVAKSNSAPFSVQMVALFNPEAGYATYVIPPAYVLIFHQTLILSIIICGLTGQGSFFERKLILQQTNPALLSFSFVAGKFLSYLLIYSVYFLIFMLFVPYWYNLPTLTHLPVLALFMVPFIGSISLFGYCLSFMIRKIDAAFWLLLPLSILIFFMSGISWPKELMPSLFNWVGYLIPAIPSIDGLVHVNQMGSTLSEVKEPLYHLWFLMIGYGIIALIMNYFYIKKTRSFRLSK